MLAPLAGVTLNFEVTIREVRAATTEELAHGHVHGPHGHGHGHDHEHAHSHATPGEAHSHDSHEHRDLAAIRALIEGSPLPEWVRQKSVAVFHRIAVADGACVVVRPGNDVGDVDSCTHRVGHHHTERRVAGRHGGLDDEQMTERRVGLGGALALQWHFSLEPTQRCLLWRQSQRQHAIEF